VSIIEQIRFHEGVRSKPYRCTAGKLTIGVGHNLDDNGLSDAAINFILNEDLETARAELDRVTPWWRDLSSNRQDVLVDMVFNLGAPRLLRFRGMLFQAQSGDFNAAADEMLDSQWARQVGERAQTLARMMRHDYSFADARMA
jgi:lysozyme